MSSQVQILATRQNAFPGIFTVLPHENREEFEPVAAAIRDEFKPEGENENFLVGEMIQARSKLLRLQRLESAAHEQILTEPGSAGDPDSRILVALAKSGNVLDKLDRYAAAARRCYYKALRAALRRDDPAGHPSVTGRSPNEPNPGYPSDNGTMVTRANSSGITSALAGLAAVSR